jgi:hypothetical protein
VLAKLQTAWAGLKDNPYHVIIAFSLIGVGINMICEPQPFVWPPYVRDIANDHGFDIAFVLIGIVMLLWCMSKSHHEEWDAATLGLAAFLMATLTVYQLLHAAHTGAFMPWVQDAALLALIVVLAARSDADDELD